MYQGQLVFLNKKNSGNGHATDDENNESNEEDTSTDEEKIESDEEKTSDDGDKSVWRLLSRSPHRTTNFTNPEFQFPQFKVLQSAFFIFCV